MSTDNVYKIIVFSGFGPLVDHLYKDKNNVPQTVRVTEGCGDSVLIDTFYVAFRENALYTTNQEPTGFEFSDKIHELKRNDYNKIITVGDVKYEIKSCYNNYNIYKCITNNNLDFENWHESIINFNREEMLFGNSCSIRKF